MREEVTRGIEPHPEFKEFSNARLEPHEALIDEKILWAKEDGDDFAINWYECEMTLLQAERARRTGRPNLTSDYRNPLSEVKFEREIN